MDTFNKIAGVSDAQRSDAASPPPAPNPITLHNNKSTTTIPPAPPPKDGATSDRRASVPLSRRPSQKSIKSVKSAKSSRSRISAVTKSREASRTNLQIQNGEIPPPPRISTAERNLYGDVAAQPVLAKSTASVAPSIRSSRRPRQSTAHGEDDGASIIEGDEDDEFEWGPQHPCFPHPNPHCTPKSQEYDETRVIRVKRDYLIAGDLYPQFANLYPEILDPLVTDEEFRDLILHVNSILLKAYSPHSLRAWTDAILGVATGYFWDDLGFTGAKAGERVLEGWIEMWNESREKEGRQVRLVQPRTTGFMSMDFVIPDPGIDIIGDSDAEDEEDDGADATTGSQQISIGTALRA